MSLKAMKAEAANMPPLFHNDPDALLFDINQSEVVKWLVAQPGMKLYVFERAKDAGAIVFDRETRKWRGASVP